MGEFELGSYFEGADDQLLFIRVEREKNTKEYSNLENCNYKSVLQ
jgi:hypothetical protein